MAPAFDNKMRVVVVGGGNGAQTAAGVMGAKGHEVFMLFGPTYGARAAALSSALAANGGAVILEDSTAGGESPVVTRGPVAGVTTDAAAVVPFADVIVISLNGPAIEGAVEQIAPFLRPEQLLLFLMGMGGVHYQQVLDATRRHGVPAPPIYAASKTLPWATRANAPARVSIGGGKTEVGIAVAPDAGALVRAMLPPMLSELFAPVKFTLAANPLDATWLPYEITHFVHPALMYSQWAEWDGTPLANKPLFYHGASREGAELLEALQSEAMAVIAAMSGYLGLSEPVQYDDLKTQLCKFYKGRIGDTSSTWSCMRTNEAYAGIYHPCKQAPCGGYVPDFSSRLLTEDVPYTLIPVRGAAEALGMATPTLDKVISWAQGKMGKEFLVDGRLCGRDIISTTAPQRRGPDVHPEDLLISGALPRAAAAAPAPAARPAAPKPAAAPAVPAKPVSPFEAAAAEAPRLAAARSAALARGASLFGDEPIFGSHPSAAAAAGRVGSLFQSKASLGAARLSMLRTLTALTGAVDCAAAAPAPAAAVRGCATAASAASGGLAGSFTAQPPRAAIA